MSAGRFNTLPPYPVFSAVDLSTDQTSDVTAILNQDNVVYQCTLSGSPAGVLYVQGSVNHVPPPPIGSKPAADGDWVNITSATIAGADDVIFDLNQLPVPYIRLFWDASGGSTGSGDALVSGKKV